MNRIFKLIMAAGALMVSMPMAAEGLGGEWKGDLQVTPQVKLKLVLHVSEPGEDAQVVTMDSPDQGAFGILTEVKYLSNDSINISVPAINLNYSGKLKGNKINGTLLQNGMNLPLILESAVPEVSRQQSPEQTFPYTKDDLKIFKKKPTDITVADNMIRNRRSKKEIS